MKGLSFQFCLFFSFIQEKNKTSSLMINSRFGTLTDLIHSAPSLPLWKCFGYFILVAFGVELLVGVFLMSCIVHLEACFCFSTLFILFLSFYQLFTIQYRADSFYHLCCPQVVSFFHRAMLTVGLAVLSLWPFLSGIFGKAKVISGHCFCSTPVKVIVFEYP